VIEWVYTREQDWNLAPYMSPVGPLWIAYGDRALLAAEFVESQPNYAYGRRLRSDSLSSWIRELWDAAFHGEIVGNWQLEDIGFSAIERELLSRASEIPFGTICSYGTLATWAGFTGRARAAGRAMRRSSVAYLIPTHRVIRSDGTPALSQRDALTRMLWHYEAIDLS